MITKKDKPLFMSFLICIVFLTTINSLNGQSVKTSNHQDSLVNSYNQVGLDIFKTSYNHIDVDSNLLISPYSISVAMTMAYMGANGTTKEEMGEVLHLTSLSDFSINNSNLEIMDSLQTSGLDTMLIANSIWYRDDIQLVDDFTNVCKDKYLSQVEELNFYNLNAKDIINEWVSDNTNGKITELVEEVTPDNVLFIINALYFKGTWKKIFDESATSNKAFTLSSGADVQVSTMAQMDTFKIIDNSEIKALELPYSDGKYSMIIILPEINYGIDSLILNLDQETWSQWESEFIEHTVQVYLPKFIFDYNDNLINEFDSLGMRKAFSDAADFTNLYAPGGIWISKIMHKTLIDVNEKGSEAAAATEVEFTWGNNPILFKANRPFMFMIKNNVTGVVAFLGKVGKPIYNSNNSYLLNQATNANKELFNLYYDPMNHSIELISMQNTSGFDNMRVDLIDLSGKLIKSWLINEPVSHRISLNLPESNPKMYLVRMSNHKMVQTKKIMVR